MAHTKAGGSTNNNRDSAAKYLGVKLFSGEKAKPGAILVRQRGSRYTAGTNVRMGKDHTLYAISTGLVVFGEKRKKNFDGTTTRRKVVSVVA